MLLNHDDSCSAFSPVAKETEKHKSFIVFRDRPKMSLKRQQSTRCDSVEEVAPMHLMKSDQEDSDSTHHSNDQGCQKHKLRKEEKLAKSLNSIKKLIESRKADTLQAMENFDEDQVVLKKCPKPVSRNSKLSRFRGVSHNGKKWQVMIMGFAKKIYFGGINTEEEASHKYDRYAILMHGLEVRYFKISSILYRLKQISTTQRENCAKFSTQKSSWSNSDIIAYS